MEARGQGAGSADKYERQPNSSQREGRQRSGDSPAIGLDRPDERIHFKPRCRHHNLGGINADQETKKKEKKKRKRRRRGSARRALVRQTDSMVVLEKRHRRSRARAHSNSSQHAERANNQPVHNKNCLQINCHLPEYR